ATVIDAFAGRPELGRLGICHFDAHPDLGRLEDGAEADHGNFMSRVLACRDVRLLAQFGCRTWASQALLDLSKRHPIVRMSVPELRRRGMKAALAKMPASL